MDSEELPPVGFYQVTCETRNCDDAYIAKRVTCVIPETGIPQVYCGVCSQQIFRVKPTI